MLLALDWGNSNLRAAVLGRAGVPRQSLSLPQGAASLGPHEFAAVLHHVRDCLDAHGLPAIACGAAGAREGWVEAPYVALPADPIAVAAHLVAVPDADLRIVPGLCTTSAPRSILRGEESQIIGLGIADGLVCLPGTHSKWVTLEAGRVMRFQSHMTGELYALVARHSRISVASDPDDPDGFARGLAMAERPAPLGASLFTLRADRILGDLPDSQSNAALAGLLIGCEVAHALSDAGRAPDILCGEPAMTRRYAQALARHGKSAADVDGTEAAWRGLWRIACTAGLIDG